MLFVISCVPAFAAPGVSSEFLSYQLDIELHPAEQTLAATATILLPRGARDVTLQLAAGAHISGVELDGAATAYAFQDGRLTIPALGTAGASPARLAVSYRARFADPPPAETVGIEDPSFGVSATISRDGTYLSADTPWFPQVSGARGRHHVRVNAPASFIAVTAGRLADTFTRDGRTITVWENDFPLDGLALAAGRLEMARDELDGIQLLTFLSAENAALAPGYLAAIRRHLAFYRDLLGPYPFAKFAVVENFLPTGYGLPSWTLLGKSVVRLPFLLDTSLPHEIVHSWWGNAIEVDYASGNWAEGLTTYLADYLLKERSDPEEALVYRRKLLRDYAALVGTGREFPLRDFTGRMNKAQQAIGYGKGAMVFHMLRREIGDAAFYGGLRQMAVHGRGRSLAWSDLETIFADAAGQDLRWFFSQWLELPGGPQVAFDEIRLQADGDSWAVSGVVRQTEPSYRFELPLRLTNADGTSLVRSVTITRADTPFRFVLSSRPVSLEGDPAVDMFRLLAPDELPPTVNDLTNPRQPLVVIADGQQTLLDAARTLLKGLRWDGADLVAEAELDPARLADRDLLLLGWPRRAELRPALPAALVIDGADRPQGWRLAGADTAGDVLFAVLGRRQARQGARAILLAHTPDAARAVAAKISHYGRFSLLLFDAGRNLTKLTWEAERSPLSIRFPKEL